ncbi:MAG: YicC/YloC family endoribonuclease [Thermodesulfobacteriota bacterium]
MLKSMTGFGRAAFTLAGDEFTLEVRTLNHRHLDIKTRIPNSFSALEPKIGGLVKEHCERGSVAVSLQYGGERGSGGGASAPRLDMKAAKSYLKAARELKKTLGLPGEIDLTLMLAQKDIFTSRGPALSTKETWAAVSKGLNEALNAVETWRIKEGKTLTKDLKKRIRSIKTFLSKVERALPAMRKAQKERLAARIAKLSPNALTEPAVLVETAVFAEKTDVTEEIVRLKSHLEAFGQFLEGDGPTGKRLDFLSQEILRELNTIGSKAQDAFIGQTIVSMKLEVEKIREQALNIE